MQLHWKDHPWNNNSKWSTYKDTTIRIQSTNEFRFLERIEQQYGIEWLKENVNRGKCFDYFDPSTNKTRLYISDFCISNTIYEIKGSYTWNRNGANTLLQQVNESKLDAVKKCGYKVILVLDDEEIEYA